MSATRTDQRELQRRQNREKEARMVRNALGSAPFTGECRAEDLRSPDYERWLVERAERAAERRRP